MSNKNARILKQFTGKDKTLPCQNTKTRKLQNPNELPDYFAIAGVNQTFQNLENGCRWLSWRNSKLKIAKARKLENRKSRMSYQGTFAKDSENLSLPPLEQTSYCMTGETPEKSKAKLWATELKKPQILTALSLAIKPESRNSFKNTRNSEFKKSNAEISCAAAVLLVKSVRVGVSLDDLLALRLNAMPNY